jgi:hypothetical protein
MKNIQGKVSSKYFLEVRYFASKYGTVNVDNLPRYSF